MNYHSLKIINILEQLIPLMDPTKSQGEATWREFLIDSLEQLKKPHDIVDVAQDIFFRFRMKGSLFDTNLHDSKANDLLHSTLYKACDNARLKERVTDAQKIRDILNEIIPLLRLDPAPKPTYYREFLENTIKQFDSKSFDLVEVVENILKEYGSIENMNDFNLRNEGVILEFETNLVKSLFEELFISCKKIINESYDANNI
ncbi:MAG: hypothetical protein JSR17_12605 [Proteobacteria bacterium]|nr:hypothetical protein [Pseudomonadota bacterium]